MVDKVRINNKTYKLNIERAIELGILEEITFKISTDSTSAMVISE